MQAVDVTVGIYACLRYLRLLWHRQLPDHEKLFGPSEGGRRSSVGAQQSSQMQGQISVQGHVRWENAQHKVENLRPDRR